MPQNIHWVHTGNNNVVWAEKVEYDDGQWGTAVIDGQHYTVCWSCDGDGYSQMADPDILRYEAAKRQQSAIHKPEEIIILQPIQVRRSDLDALIVAGVNFYGPDRALRAVLPSGTKEEEGTHSTYILSDRVVIVSKPRKSKENELSNNRKYAHWKRYTSIMVRTPG